MGKSRAFLKLLDTITGYLLFLFIFLFFLCVYLSIFSANKVILTTLNKTFHNLTLVIFFLHAETVPQRCSSGGGCSVDVLRIFKGVSVGVILIKLQSGFFEIALLSCFSPVGLLRAWGAHSLDSTSGRLLLNRDNLDTIFDLFFLIKCTFGNFKVSVLL